MRGGVVGVGAPLDEDEGGGGASDDAGGGGGGGVGEGAGVGAEDKVEGRRSPPAGVGCVVASS